MQELIGNQLGPYQIISRVGSGGMTVVYKAYQPNLERYVALKVLSPHHMQQPAILERFNQEIQIIARLEHPHIVPMYDYGQSEGYFYMVMRLIESGSLYDRFHGQPFGLGQIRQIISQVGDALDYAHSKGIIHRDIKMKNILMDNRDNALLSDFGIAKVLESDANLTQVGRTLGTPTHMAPEQIQGDPVDGRTDIYALGVLLFQLSTGRTPYYADSSPDIIMMHLYNPVPSARAINPTLPEALDKVISTALAKIPAERYATAGEMVRAVHEATFDKTPTLVDQELSTTLPSIVALEKRPTPEETEKTIHLPEPPQESTPKRQASAPAPTMGRPRPHRTSRLSRLVLLFGGVTILLLVVVIGLIVYLARQTPVASQTAGGDVSLSGAVTANLPTPQPSPAATAPSPAELVWEELLKRPEIVQVAGANEAEGLVFDDLYQDFILQAEVVQLKGSPDSSYGLTFREDENSDNYYSFEISPDGFWGFYKISNCLETDCEAQLLRGGETEAIHAQGLQTLQVEAVGPDFTLYINGEKVEDLTDTAFSEGHAGVIVTTGDEGGAEVRFERLKIAALK
jgi:serine/threonine protein kinase